MKCTKKIITFILPLLLMPFAYASTLGNAFQPIQDLLLKIMEIGSFVWVSDRLSAVKFAIFIIVFAVVFHVLHHGISIRNRSATPIFSGQNGKKVSAVISIAIAAITAIFIPDPLAMQFGRMYSAVFALLLIGLPVGILIYLSITLTNGDAIDKRVKHGVRFLAALIALTIVSGVAKEYGTLSFIIPILISRKK